MKLCWVLIKVRRRRRRRRRSKVYSERAGRVIQSNRSELRGRRRGKRRRRRRRRRKSRRRRRRRKARSEFDITVSSARMVGASEALVSACYNVLNLERKECVCQRLTVEGLRGRVHTHKGNASNRRARSIRQAAALSGLTARLPPPKPPCLPAPPPSSSFLLPLLLLIHLPSPTPTPPTVCAGNTICRRLHTRCRRT